VWVGSYAYTLVKSAVVRHPRSPRLTILLAGSLTAAVLTAASPQGATIPFETPRVLPMTMLWAWERPEHLRFLNSTATGVAFLDRTITIDKDSSRVRPRFQPLVVPETVPLVAVVRVETSTRTVWSDSLERRVAEQVAAAANAGVTAVQIDFDATLSERSAYRRVIGHVRAALPPTVGLQITALASWCLGDPWIRDLPVDDAVPMLFRMGPDDRNVRQHLSAGGDFSLPMCRHSIGVSSDEPTPHGPAGRRQYIFNPRAWTQEAFRVVAPERER
jgi:hypothetical protein